MKEKEFWVLGDSTQEAYLVHTKCGIALFADYQIPHITLEDLNKVAKEHNCEQEKP